VLGSGPVSADSFAATKEIDNYRCIADGPAGFENSSRCTRWNSSRTLDGGLIHNPRAMVIRLRASVASSTLGANVHGNLERNQLTIRSLITMPAVSTIITKTVKTQYGKLEKNATISFDGALIASVSQRVPLWLYPINAASGRPIR